MEVAKLAVFTESADFCKELQIPHKHNLVFSFLGQGEYNINYTFDHPISGKKLVMRITTGSQMHLSNQIRYEYEALKLLADTGRTPKPLYVDDRCEYIPYGMLVMEFLPGQPLDYNENLQEAAACLAEIHNTKIPLKNHLIAPENPLKAMLDESKQLAKVYIDSELGDNAVKEKIRKLIAISNRIIDSKPRVDNRRCIINTELNSGNFLINGKGKPNYLIDWEKPLYAFAEQDLGHFLAPTTTNWKTETILSKEQMYGFIKTYCNFSEQYKNADELWESTLFYLAMTCLRGISWSAMAWIEYQNPHKLIQNKYTFDKINKYLTPEFLDMLITDYLGGQ